MGPPSLMKKDAILAAWHRADGLSFNHSTLSQQRCLCNRSATGPKNVSIRSLHLMLVKMGYGNLSHHSRPRIMWYPSYDPNRITFPFFRSFGLLVPSGCPGEGE
jgi:hypothetical protein